MRREQWLEHASETAQTDTIFERQMIIAPIVWLWFDHRSVCAVRATYQGVTALFHLQIPDLFEASIAAVQTP